MEIGLERKKGWSNAHDYAMVNGRQQARNTNIPTLHKLHLTWSKTTTARGSHSLHQHGYVHDADLQKMKSKWMEPERLRNSLFVHHSQPVAYPYTKRRRTTCWVARPMVFFAFYNGFKNVCDSSEMANTSEGHNHTASIARKASFAQRQGAQATTKMLA
jgi:hypothetical protein